MVSVGCGIGCACPCVGACVRVCIWMCVYKGADVGMGVSNMLLMPSRSESCSESCVCKWMCVYKGADVGMGVCLKGCGCGYGCVGTAAHALPL